MILDELGAFLVSNGLGVLGTDLFLGVEPPDPDAITALHEYGGSGPIHVYGTAGPAIESVRIQVVTRGAPADYVEPRGRAESAYRALDSIANQTQSGTWFIRVVALQSPFSLGPDANGRFKIVFNIEATKVPS